jgi:hypothetical protein
VVTEKDSVDIVISAEHTAPGAFIQRVIVHQSGGPVQSVPKTHDQAGYPLTKTGLLITGLTALGVYNYAVNIFDNLGNTAYQSFTVTKKAPAPAVVYIKSAQVINKVFPDGITRPTVVITYTNGKVVTIDKLV